MPFTPYHFGLGIAFKALAPQHVALPPFFLAQVAMDVEPGIRLALGAEVLHGWTHTWSGALAVGEAVAALGYPLQGRRIWRFNLGPSTPAVLLGSALLGTLSHVWLDSLMHADMAEILASWAGPAAQRLAHEGIERGCLLAAASGLALWLGRAGPRQALRSIRGAWVIFLAAPAWFRRSDR